MEPFFTTQSLTLPAANKIPAEGGGGDSHQQTITKHVCVVTYDGRKYVFRYAYDTLAQAQSVLGNIRRHFGKPAGIETDLAFNYWRLLRDTRAWMFIQRTTSKNSHYISREG